MQFPKNYTTKGELEWLAFDAGNDMLCFAEHVPEGIRTILKNASTAQIEDSFQRIWKLKEKAIVQKTTISNELSNADELNCKLAENSLTLLKGNAADISTFRNKDFCTLTIKRSVLDQGTQEILDGLKEMKSEVEQEKDILILLTPPQVKPANIFGLLAEEIAFINKLIKTKNVVLYLFGNPYVLNHLHIEKAVAVVIAYQTFTEFQDVATAHFLGKITAKGKLPVTIN